MQVQFERLIINDYKSIQSGELEYRAGVWHLVGNNNDSFSSNGAGKSTAIEAIQQCLFNRTSKGLTIATANNKVTGKSYNISVIFTIGADRYLVNNSRTSMKITISKEIEGSFVDLGVRSTPAALTKIQELIGVDFNTFVAITHVTHSTIVDMVDNFTSSNLMKVILDFGLITKFDKKIKENLKESTEKSRHLAQKKEQAEASLKLVDTFKYIDTAGTKASIISYTATEVALTQQHKELESQWRKDTTSVGKIVLETSFRIKELKEKLDTECSYCGSEIVPLSQEERRTVESSIQYETEQLELVESEDSTLRSNFNIHSQDISKDLEEARDAIRQLGSKLSIDEYHNSMYESNKDGVQELKEVIAECEGQLPDLYKEQDMLQEAIRLLKAGIIHKELIQNFCTVYNLYINDLLKYVSINNLVIGVTPKKNSIDFNVFDKRFNSEININELSGGELTRVRVVLLLGMIKAIQTLTKVSVNLLVFDESLDTLDSSATEDLAKLFHYLAQNDNKFIALVSHGQQLGSIDFTGTITLNKTDGVSVINQEL